MEDAEQEIKNSHEVISNLNEKTLHYEFKQAELASLDVAVLKAKVTDLEKLSNKKVDLLPLAGSHHNIVSIVQLQYCIFKPTPISYREQKFTTI